MKTKITLWTSAVLLATCWLAAPPADAATLLTSSDGVIRNSLCVGFDCPGSPSFSDTTILLVENNTRIKFDDTSTASSFPRNDWELQANSSTNGGGNFFAINDCGESSGGGCADDPVFKVTAGAPENSIFVNSSGRVGLKTGTPALELHIRDGDSPAVRLEQDGSSGFTPQTWDLAGNETNFFVRDVTGGSGLPLRIRPGAGSNAIYVHNDAKVGLGTSSPNTDLDIVDPGADDTVDIGLRNGTTDWRFQNFNNIFRVTLAGTGVAELELDGSGNLTIQGNCSQVSTPGSCADYVFEPDYELRTLDELAAFIAENKHLPNVPSTEEIKKNGVNVQHFQGRLLEKIEELTLYTLQQQETIRALTARLEKLEKPD